MPCMAIDLFCGEEKGIIKRLFGQKRKVLFEY